MNGLCMTMLDCSDISGIIVEETLWSTRTIAETSQQRYLSFVKSKELSSTGVKERRGWCALKQGRITSC